MKLTFRIETPYNVRTGIGTGDSEHFYPLKLGLEYLTKVNLWHLSKASYPPLYSSGVVYQNEAPGDEDWCDIPTCIAQRWGDCEDLGCWRAAELQAAGVKAVAWPKARLIGDIYLVHIQVKYPNGDIEDPSRILGMGAHR